MLRLFDLTLFFKGFPIYKAKDELNKIIALSNIEYVSFLENKKKEILNYHLENNSYYRSLVGQLHFENWEDVPVMTKKDFQIPLKQRISKNFKSKSIYTNKTSGSSGDPFVFAKDKYCHALTWASNVYRFGWYNINFNYSYQARFYGIPLDFIGNTKERIKDFLSKRYRFVIFDLSEVRLEKILNKFKSNRFDYINGYTSSIVLFAKYLQSKDIILKNICPSLRVCMVTSEMLFDDDRTLLENQFGIPIVNEYGASELDLIAFENPKGEWEVNNQTIYVEIVDEYNKPLPYGESGRIVITSLFNKAHPFIRYDIGDIGVLDEKSTVYKPILKKLIGRTNDVAILPSGKKSPGLTFYYVTKSIIEDDGNVKEFIIKQTKIDVFEIDYVSILPLTDEQIAKIEKAITQYLEPNLHFIFNKKTVLIRNKRGKLKQFQSLL